MEEPADAGVANVSYNELNGWIDEMLDCSDVDSHFHIQYANTVFEAEAVKIKRLERFLDRRHQYSQFLAEDAQGKGRYRSQYQ